jgi:hypothetical protein
MTETQMIARRDRIGHKRVETIFLLRELLEEFKGDNLVHALVYHQFATVAGATKFVTKFDEARSIECSICRGEAQGLSSMKVEWDSLCVHHRMEIMEEVA